MADREVTKAPADSSRDSSSFSNSIGTSLKTQAATWFVGIVIALLSVFSSRLTESIKFAVNKADLRSSSYENLAKDLSEHVYIAGFVQESLEKGWTTKENMTPATLEYNASITKLSQNEYVYRSWLARYWNKADVAKFDDIMMTVRDVDQSVHSLNDELEKVNITHTETTVEPGRAGQAAKELAPKVEKLREQVRSLLETAM